MQIRELMTENPTFVTPEATLQRAAELMRDEDIGIVPVVDDMNNLKLQGVLTDRDITVRAVAENRDVNAPVRDVMTADGLVRLRADDSVDELLDRMGAEQIRRLLVVDDDDRLIGIVAQADVLRQLGDRRTEEVEETLEEISEPS